MTSTKLELKSSTPKVSSKKVWDVVLYSGFATAGEPGITVYRPRCKENAIETFTTAGILDKGEIIKGISMINTGPCRYIAIAPPKYHSSTSSIIVAFATDIPIENTLLSVNLLNIGGHPLIGFIPDIIEIKNCKQIDETLYSVNTKEKTYFIVVE